MVRDTGAEANVLVSLRRFSMYTQLVTMLPESGGTGKKEIPTARKAQPRWLFYSLTTGSTSCRLCVED